MLPHKEVAGAATGFVGLFAYSPLSGWPLAKVLEIWHWTVLRIIAIAAYLRAIASCYFERSGPARDQRSDAPHLCAEWAKLRNSSVCPTLSQATLFPVGFTMPAIRRRTQLRVIHAGLLNCVRVYSFGSAAARCMQNVVRRSCILSGFGIGYLTMYLIRKTLTSRRTT